MAVVEQVPSCAIGCLGCPFTPRQTLTLFALYKQGNNAFLPPKNMSSANNMQSIFQRSSEEHRLCEDAFELRVLTT